MLFAEVTARRLPDSASQLQLQLIANPDRARVRRSKQRVRGLNGIIGAVRRGGRVVDRTRLESGRTLTGTGSSNLPLSAIHPDRHFPIKQSEFQHAGSDGEGPSAAIGQCPKVNRRLAVSDRCRRAILP